MTLRDDLVTKLETENDELRARVRLLEEMIGMRIDVPLVLGLTGQEAILFGVLLRREIVTKEAAMVALYGMRPDGEEEVQIKIVDVYVCKLRKKVKRFDVEIETVWGRGYRMPPKSKAIVQAILDEARGDLPETEAVPA
jgi:two-component system cell cycle response regulator CtrA